MNKQRKRVFAKLVIFAALLSPAMSKADDVSDVHAQIRTEDWKAPEFETIEVLEEIVVIGRRRSWFPGLSRVLKIEPMLNGLRRFDLQVFPAYNPVQVERSILRQFNRSVEDSGMIEIFRLRLGR